MEALPERFAEIHEALRRAPASVRRLRCSPSSSAARCARRLTHGRMAPDACGVDEAGRGPIAVRLCSRRHPRARHAHRRARRLEKALRARRDELAAAIRGRAAAWAIASATVEEIDRLNILRATLLAMQRAIESLAIAPTEAWVDGLHVPRVAMPARAIVGATPVSRRSRRHRSLRRRRAMRDDAARRAVSAIRVRATQGLSDSRPPRGARAAWPCEVYRRSFGPVRALIDAGRDAQGGLF